MSDRLGRQLAFLAEADRLKTVLRANTLADGSRRENSGEHSWHVALYALILADQAGPDVRIDRVLRMLLIHDLVEIDCGDTPIHGSHDAASVAAAESAAADRIFRLLPEDQAAEFRALWEEFEASLSPDAVFAKSIDRVQPVMQNLQSGGGTWKEFAVTSEQLDTRVGAKIARGAPGLWAHVRALTRCYFDRAAG
ncbi:HD domain-containing protein [Cereibacter sphaeroides]|uniref:HD domain-containing protein n=1 Tax=Cereibacter sphaeroides TaxID=1063 RepID=UPI00076F7A2E|nr:HD domain-containing protein [Cereibacter sphaeroides]AMJ47907.1 hydrolase [Cereibacter sphaeroides]ANS34616.1 hydrolase [Cereibacter sphaeroides]ATN63664.1 hydrolase [Cereibacter sphaeroides]AXC61830.1 HD domain-containing protein [Cereibacter sphaeroides 2.4.1]AZB63194.1 HD domain-containing protein [Cereibacter sphaeroides]